MQQNTPSSRNSCGVASILNSWPLFRHHKKKPHKKTRLFSTKSTNRTQKILSPLGQIFLFSSGGMLGKTRDSQDIDLKVFEPAMRHLLDTYIRAEDSVKISAFEDLSLIDLIVQHGAEALKNLPKAIRDNNNASAEAIENNLRKIIVDEQPINPKYYEKMSQLLDQLIQKRKEQALEYKAYLEEIRQLSTQVTDPTCSTDYPSAINTSAKRALYDNLERNTALATVLDNEVCNTKKDGWRGDRIKEREVLAAIRKHIPEQDVERIFEIVKNQKDD